MCLLDILNVRWAYLIQIPFVPCTIFFNLLWCWQIAQQLLADSTGPNVLGCQICHQLPWSARNQSWSWQLYNTEVNTRNLCKVLNRLYFRLSFVLSQSDVHQMLNQLGFQNQSGIQLRASQSKSSVWYTSHPDLVFSLSLQGLLQSWKLN